MKLYPVSAMGIHAFCSDVIVDPNNPEIVHFLSISGYQATVKGIIANLLENNGIGIEIDGDMVFLERSSLGYKVQVKKLPSGLAHGVVYPKLALPKNDEENQHRFYIFADKSEDVQKLFFRHLDEKSDIPFRNW